MAEEKLASYTFVGLVVDDVGYSDLINFRSGWNSKVMQIPYLSVHQILYFQRHWIPIRLDSYVNFTEMMQII